MRKPKQLGRGYQWAIAATMPVAAVWIIWNVLTTSSVSVPLAEPGLKVNYSMVRGLFGMKQNITVSEHALQVFGASSGWSDIFKRPYNSGVAVYRSVDGKTYFFGTGYMLYKYEMFSGKLQYSCNTHWIPPENSFGRELMRSGNREEMERLDPGSTRLWRYLEEDQLGSRLLKEPIKSRYYRDLIYEGRIGLVRSPSRPLKAGFAPADKAAEPRFGLHFSCG